MLRNPIVRLLGYCFFISPPKALDIIKSQPADGELKNLPVWFVVLIEGLIRIGLLLLISTTIQEFILGKAYYEIMQLDICFAVVAIVGLFHFTIYYLLVVQNSKGESRAFMLSIYRLFRNLGYASLSGLPFYAFANLALSEKLVAISFEEVILPITFLITLVFATAGLIEGVFRRRVPLGLDDYP